MDRIQGRVVEIGISETFGVSSGALGMTAFDGIEIETAEGPVRIPYLVAGGRVTSLLDRALESGAEVELHLSGTADCRLAYAIRTEGQEVYDPTIAARDSWLLALRYAIVGVLSLFFVVGAFVLVYAAYLAWRASRFRPALSKRAFFARGKDDVGPGREVVAA